MNRELTDTMRRNLLCFHYMKNSSLTVFGWFLVLSTLAVAAPKAKYGERKQANKPPSFLAHQQTPKKGFVPKSSVNSVAPDGNGWDTIVYKAQRMASEMTLEVGYLLKQSGPWLKELEDELRGVKSPTAEAPAATKRSG